jgi:hypothetical protein
MPNLDERGDRSDHNRLRLAASDGIHAALAMSLMFTEGNSERVRDAFQTALAFAERREDSYHKAQRRLAGSEPDDGAAGVASTRGYAL